MVIKILLLLIFFSVMVGVGFYSRRHAGSVNDFVLGGRSVGPWLTAFAYGTSYFSAVVFVGYAGQFGWKYGLSSTWIGIGNALIGSLLAWVILGRRTRIMTNHLEAATMPDFFGKRFDSNALRIAASAIAFVFLIPYTASLYNGLSRLFGMSFDIPYTACVVLMAALTAVYVILGGYMATAINDFIQGIVMLGGIVAVIAAVLGGKGGFMNAVAELAKLESDVPVTAGQPGAFTAFFGPDPLNLLGVVILTSLGTWGLPQMVHKFYTIKDEKAVTAGTIISTFFALVISGGCYFLGGFARLFDNQSLYGPDGAIAYDAVIPSMLSTLPDLLIGIVIILVLSASMSTLSSLVLTSSSTLTLDFIKGNLVKDMSDKVQLLVMRVLIVFFIVVSVVLALNPPTFIAQLMGISWGALAGAFLAPFLYGLCWRKVTRPAVWASFICGVGITVLNMFLHFIQSPINAGAAAMIAGLVVVPVVSLITPVFDKKKVDDIFECYEETVSVRKKTSLPEKA
ncbi:MAG: sodium:solute symporter [Lachnospiraceae bacterium]|jgi:SSS family solute:Na+ symporter|nr:sodium:solute symporter [Lachnospiraceae bacterium]MCI9100753.1 sodium:solute symporter [Lachnospiraceae bacterium]MCI9358198.1 sodium:solute symporter [Lachnospiraceae bacterium]